MFVIVYVHRTNSKNIQIFANPILKIFSESGYTEDMNLARKLFLDMICNKCGMQKKAALLSGTAIKKIFSEENKSQKHK